MAEEAFPAEVMARNTKAAAVVLPTRMLHHLINAMAMTRTKHPTMDQDWNYLDPQRELSLTKIYTKRFGKRPGDYLD